jgi:thiosulfate/3-mercaptopyruvate sulfurtransferase
MNTQTLISAAELAALIEHADPLILDCRKQLDAPDRGREAYTAAHLPGAMYAELDRDLSDLSRPHLGRHPLPFEEDFSTVLGAWGWRPGRPVVTYDDAGGALAAARAWWLLRLVGERDVRVLDGGYAAWLKAGGATEARFPTIETTRVSVRYDAGQLVDGAALKAGLADGTVCLLDARGAPRYRGETEPLDRVAGHVPGARNRPFTDNLDSEGKFRTPAQLAAGFRPLIEPFAPAQVVHMCGSGVTACHNLLAMEHAGLTGSRLYAPSWSGWLADPGNPVATGPQP